MIKNEHWPRIDVIKNGKFEKASDFSDSRRSVPLGKLTDDCFKSEILSIVTSKDLQRYEKSGVLFLNDVTDTHKQKPTVIFALVLNSKGVKIIYDDIEKSKDKEKESYDTYLSSIEYHRGKNLDKLRQKLQIKKQEKESELLDLSYDMVNTINFLTKKVAMDISNAFRLNHEVYSVVQETIEKLFKKFIISLVKKVKEEIVDKKEE